MSVVYALLLAVLAIGVQSQSVAEQYQWYPCDFNDVSPVMYPLYEDCDSFIQCQYGKLTREQCPTGTVADFALNNCVPKDGQIVLDCAKLVKDKSKRRRR